MKTITAVIICISIFISVNCIAADEKNLPVNTNDTTIGQVTGNLDGKFKILLGDKAITNLGKKSGVIKGDIFKLYDKKDPKMMDTIGKCAVVDIYDMSSVCEIIEMKREIGVDNATIKKLKYEDANLLPPIFALLTKIVEPYPPHKEIRVFIYDIFDENRNVTKFSEKVKSEMKKIFFQKKRIKSAGRGVSSSLFAYLPGEYSEYNKEIEEYLEKDQIDVIISGTYKIKEDKEKGKRIELSFYKIDKNWEDLALDTMIPAAPYTQLVSAVTVPFTERKKEKTVNCQIIYKPVHHKTTSRDERNDIISYETRNNPILEYTLRRAEFNIVTPTDFTVTIDKNEFRFDKQKEYIIPLSTGNHTIKASFKKGFYYNDTFLVALSDQDRIAQKDAILTIDRPEDLVIEIEANPLPRKENIVFKIYRKSTRSATMMKPVLQREILKPVETYKD
ncbi:MAG TPA: hypothetical protein PLR60_06580 [Syntrophorhabdaceae bacterium]|nr:hypothetical protein [Syntrophorhabdaceae bacterium]